MMLREMAKEQNRKLTAVMDTIILAEYLKTHDNAGRPFPEMLARKYQPERR